MTKNCHYTFALAYLCAFDKVLLQKYPPKL